MLDERTRLARALFDDIARDYERPAALLSFGQFGRWRRALVGSLPINREARVLDVATGTGLIAREITRRHGCAVVGLDQSAGMLARARARSGPRFTVVGGTAGLLPFPEGCFDAVVFSYLLRYVQDPERTLGELARVVRPGGTLASVEFGVPAATPARLGWRLYARGVFPLLCHLFGRGWRAVGSFLPSSILAWADVWPPERQAGAWRAAGLEDVRMRRLTLGAGVVVVGRKRGA